MTTAASSADAVQPAGQAAAGSVLPQARLRARCPHCKSFARARSTKPLTPTYFEVRFECNNVSCGHIWVAGMEALRTLCPSAQPDPTVHLPLARHLMDALAQPATPNAPASAR